MFCFFCSPFPTSPIPELPLLTFFSGAQQCPTCWFCSLLAEQKPSCTRELDQLCNGAREFMMAKWDCVAEKVRERKIFGVTETDLCNFMLEM